MRQRLHDGVHAARRLRRAWCSDGLPRRIERVHQGAAMVDVSTKTAGMADGARRPIGACDRGAVAGDRQIHEGLLR